MEGGGGSVRTEEGRSGGMRSRKEKVEVQTGGVVLGEGTEHERVVNKERWR